MKDSELIKILEEIEKDAEFKWVMPPPDEYKEDELTIVFSNVWGRDRTLIEILEKTESNTDVKFRIVPDDEFIEDDELLVIASNVWEDK